VVEGRLARHPLTTIETTYARRARYYSSADGFNIKRSRIPAQVFLRERDRALDPATPTGFLPLDLSAALGSDGPATTPLILTRGTHGSAPASRWPRASRPRARSTT